MTVNRLTATLAALIAAAVPLHAQRGDKGHTNQPLRVARVFVHKDYCFANCRMFFERFFNLAQLDAESANLDLVVDAPQKINCAIRSITYQVSRSIKSRPRLVRKRIG